jgi:threonine synthase
LAGRGLVQIEDFSDRNIQKAFRFVRKHIACEPSSAIVFAAAETFRKYLRNADRPVVLINSGKGLE